MNEKLAALKRLVEIVEKLRAPGGCPWDQQQTLVDMGRHMVEEVSEVVDAIAESDGKPSPQICEELGDVLMNIILAATIAEERRPARSDHSFSLADIAEEVSEKLVRRHPHVFGDTKVEDVDEVLANWNVIKARERKHARGLAGGTDRGERTGESRLDVVPRSLPPLVRAFELGREAAKAGFDWPDAAGAFEKVEEEIEEVRSLLQKRAHRVSSTGRGEDSADPGLEEELGDLLFAVVSLCRKAAVRPDEALRSTLKKFYQRFQAIEERFPDMEGQCLDAMEKVWQEEKRRPKREPDGAGRR